MKKLLILTFFTICTFLMLALTYGVFESKILRGASIEIANWSVMVNDGIVSSEEKTFTIDDIIWDANDNVASGKVAPGIEGYFDIVINPNSTDVSVRYDITYDVEYMKSINPAFTITQVTELNNSIVLTDTNTYTGLILLNDINNNNSHTVRTYVKWEDIEENSANDYKTGSEQVNLKIPVTILVSQYLGEDIIEYSNN